MKAKKRPILIILQLLPALLLVVLTAARFFLALTEAQRTGIRSFDYSEYYSQGPTLVSIVCIILLLACRIAVCLLTYFQCKDFPALLKLTLLRLLSFASTAVIAFLPDFSLFGFEAVFFLLLAVLPFNAALLLMKRFHPGKAGRAETKRPPVPRSVYIVITAWSALVMAVCSITIYFTSKSENYVPLFIIAIIVAAFLPFAEHLATAIISREIKRFIVFSLIQTALNLVLFSPNYISEFRITSPYGGGHFIPYSIFILNTTVLLVIIRLLIFMITKKNLTGALALLPGGVTFFLTIILRLVLNFKSYIPVFLSWYPIIDERVAESILLDTVAAAAAVNLIILVVTTLRETEVKKLIQACAVQTGVFAAVFWLRSALAYTEFFSNKSLSHLHTTDTLPAFDSIRLWFPAAVLLAAAAAVGIKALFKKKQKSAADFLNET